MAETGYEYLQSDTKRRLDLIGGLVGATALLPVGISVAIASAIDCRDPNPIFQQTRVGKGGSLFEVIKFRTIRRSRLQQEVETFGTFDPRATRFGLFLRQSGIDEMPQLLNVLRGEMSLVGIRPLIQKEVEVMRGTDPVLFEEWQEAYTSAKPGLTGPGQLLRHYYVSPPEEVFNESMRLDIDYLENASLQRDLKIIADTPISLLRANAHTIPLEQSGHTLAA